jgi:Tol biopolymer transport system component
MSKRIPSWFLALLIVAGVALLGLFWSVAAYATFPGTDGLIAFRSGSDMDTMEPDGTGVTQLTHSPGNDRYPSWSADGAQIVFRRVNPGGQFGIFTMNADGSNLARLTPGNTGVNTQPTWTPDGRIVFSSNRENPTCGSNFDECNFQLFIMNADGSNVQRLTSGTGVSSLSYALPSVSPDGTMVAFTMTDAATAGSDFFIGTIPISGGPHTGTPLVTAPAIDPAWPDWSPDGKKIVFSNNGCRICPTAGQPSNVFVLELLGGAVTQLTFTTSPPSPNNYIQPHWDPDQNSIVFTNAPLTGDPGSIYTMNSDGTGITCVIGSVAAPAQSTCNVVSSANNETPTWQPE